MLWAWCPTVALEAGNNAHVDVLAAGFAAAALILLARPGWPGSSAGPLRRPLAGGALLALAIWTKVTPVLIAPAVLRRRPVAVICAGITATVIVYLPHVLAVGSGVIGFLPGYLHRRATRTAPGSCCSACWCRGSGASRRLRDPGHGRPASSCCAVIRTGPGAAPW